MVCIVTLMSLNLQVSMMTTFELGGHPIAARGMAIYKKSLLNEESKRCLTHHKMKSQSGFQGNENALIILHSLLNEA